MPIPERQPPPHDGSSKPSPGKPVQRGQSFQPRRLQTPLDRMVRRVGGKRSMTRTDRKRGRYIRSRPAGNHFDDIALDATLRQAAPFQRQRRRENLAFAITSQDLQRKVRVRRAANLIMFVVDASWSMAAAERMAATKGAVLSLLVDAYQRRDRVGLVTFRGQEARLVLPFTTSVERAQGLLQDIPVGGKTPLPHGLLLAYKECVRALRKEPEAMPLMVLLTDGAGNVGMTGELAPQDEALRIAELIRHRGVRSVVINMEPPAFDRGLAQSLADALDAPCYTLPQLKTEALIQTVQDELRLAQ
ncbi:MAG TPA: VWA domain-containing protein [Anaerolineales bacterium]|nr:VWA domain-containing protein [Anaerolineales bacterium]